MPAKQIPPEQEKLFAIDMAVHRAGLAIPAKHQEDFARLVKVLRQISGFRLYFAEIDQLPYRDQLRQHLDEILFLAGKTTITLDLTTQVPEHAQGAALTFAEFEDRVLAAQEGCVMHVINSELWLAEHVASFNIRRNAIASQARCALIWWLPRSAMQLVAQNAPDAWSWRHGVFAFASTQDSAAEDQALPLGPSLIGEYGVIAAPLAQVSKRLAELRHMLAQAIDDDLRLPLVEEMAELLKRTGDYEQALTILRQQALPLATNLPLHNAYVMGQIADILFLRGDLEEALRIRREEELPVYRKLGDVRGYAICMGQIANILSKRGELEEALRIRREEELPVYRKQGDVRGYAICMGQIADILSQRGELEEALRIRREEVIPVLEKLGDVRQLMVAHWWMASYLQQRAQAGDFRQARQALEVALRLAEQLGVPDAEDIKRWLANLPQGD